MDNILTYLNNNKDQEFMQKRAFVGKILRWVQGSWSKHPVLTTAVGTGAGVTTLSWLLQNIWNWTNRPTLAEYRAALARNLLFGGLGGALGGGLLGASSSLLSSPSDEDASERNKRVLKGLAVGSLLGGALGLGGGYLFTEKPPKR